MERNNSPIIAEIIKNYKLISEGVTKLGKPQPLTEEQRREGLRVSKQGASTPDEVMMSPLVSEILKRTGEKTSDDWRLRASDPETKAEAWINKVEETLLREYNGSEKTEFDEQKPLLSIDHYNVQCWRNRKQNKRDIGPGQEKERNELAHKYAVATKPLDIPRLLVTDPVFSKAVMLVFNAIPEVRANNDYELVSQPFMNKDSNVSYPWFRNDRAIDPSTGKSYGQLAVELAKTVPVDQLYKYNYTTLFGRNQKLKGRAIYATSRIVNIVLNQLESEEIKRYKVKSPLFIGYNDDAALKQGLIRMTEFCEANGLKCRNVDQSKFDLHVRQAFILLVGAISMAKANGNRSKNLAYWRSVLATKTWLINGLSDDIYEIYGRIFSGYIDTNRMGGLVNAIAVLYAVMQQNREYSNLTYQTDDWMYVMGDDNLFIYNQLDYPKFQKALEDIGFEVNREKDEFGPFFLQYRLFEYEGSKVMAYAWTRVLRSLLFKETKKGLGPYGWILSWWQQLSKVAEYRPALEILVNFVAYVDEFKMGLDLTADQLLAKVREEDDAARNKLSTPNARNKFQSTWEKLSDGDPQKARFTEANKSYLQDLLDKFKEVYDPDFWNKHHLPPLSKR